nr:hypothetical protein [Tanacetum cinerariifolium]
MRRRLLRLRLHVLRFWAEKENIGSLPVVALGALSSGYFVSMLATNIEQTLQKVASLYRADFGQAKLDSNRTEANPPWLIPL